MEELRRRSKLSAELSSLSGCEGKVKVECHACFCKADTTIAGMCAGP